MKKVALTLSICLGVLCFSCDNEAKKIDENLSKTTDKEAVKTKVEKKEVTRHPDTIIDGVRIYNFKNEPAKRQEISLEEAINMFDKGVNNAQSCQELIRACATFDSNIKKLCQKDSKITISGVEKRDDVRSIRRISEEKSLKLCQTQQMR